MKRITAILFFVICACILSLQVAGQTAATKRGDARVTKALNQIKVPFELKNNVYEVTFNWTDKRTQQVFIVSETDNIYGFEMRGVFSYAMASDNPLSQEAANRLLQQNGDGTGAWSVMKMDDGKFVVMKMTYVPADADGKKLKDAISSVAELADEMEKSLTNKDEF